MSTDEEQIVTELSPDAELAADDEHIEGVVERIADYGGATDVSAVAPKSQADIEAVQQKLEREAERHAKRVAEIMGEDFALLVPSPVDWTPGFIFNVEGMLPEPEQLAALDAIMGRGSFETYSPAPDAEGCETCNALGEVLTGSKKDGQRTKPCSDCTGTGWRHKMLPPAAVQQLPNSTQQGFSIAAPPNTVQVADQYGRPFGHPHYGMNPASIGA